MAVSRGGRLVLQPCRVGVPEEGTAGWLVLFAQHLIAVLVALPHGRVALEAGFVAPFRDRLVDWPDLAAAQADFSEVAKLYRAGVPPGMIDMRFPGELGSQ